MYKLVNLFQKTVLTRTARNTSTLFLGNAVSSVLAIIFTILAAKALGPENWGYIAAVGSVIGILVAIGEIGLDASLLKFVPGLIKENQNKKAQDTVGTIFTIRIAVSFILATVLVLLARPLTGLLFKTNNTSLAIFTGLGLLGALLVDFQVAVSQAKKSWKKAALFLSLTNISRVILLAIVYLTLSLEFTSILAIYTASPLIAFAVSLLFEKNSPALNHQSKNIIRKIGSFSGWMSGNKKVSYYNYKQDVLLLIQLSTAREAGVYAAANRLALGVPLVVASFATVLAPSFSELAKDKELKIYFKKTVLFSLFLIFGLLFGILIAPYVIQLFGPEYQASKIILQLLLLGYIPFILSIPAVNALIYAFKKPQIITITTSLQLPLILITNALLIPKIGALGPVIALFLVNTTTLCISYFYTIRYFNRPE